MPKVLVVDDSSVDRSRTGGLLRKSAELSVEFANNGVQALQANRPVSSRSRIDRSDHAGDGRAGTGGADRQPVSA